MCKLEKLEEFKKLNKMEKKNLTLSWLIDLIKTQHLGVEDVIDIINSVEPTFSDADKLQTLLIKGQISVAIISRLFGFGYAKSSSIINQLLQQNVITKYEQCYKIIDKENFKKITKELVVR